MKNFSALCAWHFSRVLINWSESQSSTHSARVLARELRWEIERAEKGREKRDYEKWNKGEVAAKLSRAARRNWGEYYYEHEILWLFFICSILRPARRFLSRHCLASLAVSSQFNMCVYTRSCVTRMKNCRPLKGWLTSIRYPLSLSVASKVNDL